MSPRTVPAATIVSYPKCGRTWIRVILDDLRVPVEFDHDLGSSWDERKVPAVTLDKSRFQNRRVVFLTRNPMDVLVSNYFHLTRRSRRYERSIHDFVRDEQLGIRGVLRYRDSWMANRHIPEAFLQVSYEDLTSDAAGTIRKIIAFAGVRVRQWKLLLCVRRYRFDRMQQMERGGDFIERYGKILTPRNGVDDIESYKTRRGRVGGYVEYLSPDDIQFCETAILESHDASPLTMHGNA